MNRRSFIKQVGVGAAGVGVLAKWPDVVSAQDAAGKGLPRSTPEAQGVDSAGILGFLEAVGSSKHEFHSFMMVRHGQVIAEGWWAPYRSELTHMLYSLSKSFTSTGVGFAVSEGKLKTTDKVVSFFPDLLPDKVSENLAALKVRDLLSMSVGHAEDSTGAITKEEDWVKTFLALPIKYQPGTVFLYNSGATYMCSAIVQKVTGQKLIDYLRPRFFEPLRIEEATWETCPRGINTGGWGLNVRTESLAKFGHFILQKGAWNGKRILPAAWVEEATSFKIQQPAGPGADLEVLKNKSDWHQGYCYQFWRCRHNGVRGDGAFGQYTIMLPDQDAVIAITSETSDMQGELDLVYEHLLPAMKDKALPPNADSAALLRRKCSGLALQPRASQPAAETCARVSGKRFRIDANPMNVRALSFAFQDDSMVFTLENDKGSYPITCGLGKWIEGQTAMPGTPPKLTSGGFTGNFRVAASAGWTDPNTLEMIWRFNETPHHDTVTCRFDGGKVRVTFLNSITGLSPSRKDKRPELTGQLVG